MTESNNPLKQYFRRPSIYLRLPSQGFGYGDGAIDLPNNGEVPIYPMTTIDEITSRTPDALFNGTAIVDIIQSCVPNIKDAWQLPITDLDPLLIAIRTATNGDKMEIETTCPSCNEESKYDVLLPGVLSTLQNSDYNTPLVKDELTIKFRPLKYIEINDSNILQFEVQRMIASLQNLEDENEKSSRTSELLKKLNEMTIKLLVDTIEYIKTPTATVFEREFITEFLTNCDKLTFNSIKEKSIENRSKSELKPLQMTCMHCKHEYEQPFVINVTNFFD